MLRVVHNSDYKVKPEKLTEKQKIHNAAIAAIADRRIKNRTKLDKFFEPELKELEALKRKVAAI